MTKPKKVQPAGNIGAVIKNVTVTMAPPAEVSADVAAAMTALAKAAEANAKAIEAASRLGKADQPDNRIAIQLSDVKA